MKLGTFGLWFKLLQSAPSPVPVAVECAGVAAVPEIVNRKRRQEMSVTRGLFTITTRKKYGFF